MKEKYLEIESAFSNPLRRVFLRFENKQGEFEDSAYNIKSMDDLKETMNRYRGYGSKFYVAIEKMDHDMVIHPDSVDKFMGLFFEDHMDEVVKLNSPC